jgi:hypothetical protein
VKAHLLHFADWKLLGGSHFSLAPTVARALQCRLKQRKNPCFPHFFRDVEGVCGFFFVAHRGTKTTPLRECS